MLCPSCPALWRQWRQSHPAASRRVVYLLLLAAFFSLLGWLTDPVALPGMCHVYP